MRWMVKSVAGAAAMVLGLVFSASAVPGPAPADLLFLDESYQDVSYRLQGMSTDLVNIMADEYSDIFQFSTNLAKVDGYRFYTGLSNLEGEYRKQVGNQGDGARWEYGLNTLGFLGFYNDWHYGLIYIPGVEEVSHRSVDESKNPIGPINSERHTVSESSSNIQSSKIGVMFAKDLWPGLIVGARVLSAKDSHKDIDLYVDESFTQEINTGVGTTETNTDRYTYLEEETTNLSKLEIEGSLAAKTQLGTISLAARYAPEKCILAGKSDDSRDEKGHSSGPDDEESQIDLWNSYDNDLLSVTLNTLTLQGQWLNRTTLFGRAADVKTFASLSSGSGPLKYNYTEHEVTTITGVNTTDAVTTSSVRKDVWDSSSEGSGSAKSSTITLAGGSEMQLNPATKLAVGLRYDSGRTEVTDKVTGGNFRETSDRYENDQKDDWNSYVRTGSDTGQQTTVKTSDWSRFSIPVGIETKLADKLSLRMGVTAVLSDKGTYTRESKDEAGKFTEKKDYADPGHKGEINENDETGRWWTSSLSQSYNDSYAIYRYGLGYAVNENIQIDILRFSNLTRLDKWLLSTTIKF